MRVSWWLCWGLLVGPPVSVASAHEASPRFHVLLVVADDLRADVMSVYGGPVKTPQLERLAARGCLFRRATCGYPICHVSRTELLTGRSVVVEAAAGKGIPIPTSWSLWPDVMRRAGWTTVHAGKWHVEGTPWTRGYTKTAALFSSGGAPGQSQTHPRSATGRPVTGYVGWTFKSNDNRPQPDWGIGLTPDTDARIADGAIDVIQRRSTETLFLQVNFTAPHDPLHWPRGQENRDVADQTLPRNFRPEHPFDHGNLRGRDELLVPAPRRPDDVKRERAVYETLVENLDRQIGRIVQALNVTGEAERTLIVITSDQGLALGSHGLMGKQNQYEHTANVPLILVGPGIPQGRQVDAQCALRDLFPTVCEHAGLEVPASVQGRSLLPVLHGELQEIHDVVYGYFTTTQRMLRTADGWKMIWYPAAGRTQLFHVAVDDDELQDLSEEPVHAPRLERMRGLLTTWLREQGDDTVE